MIGLNVRIGGHIGELPPTKDKKNIGELPPTKDKKNSSELFRNHS